VPTIPGNWEVREKVHNNYGWKKSSSSFIYTTIRIWIFFTGICKCFIKFSNITILMEDSEITSVKNTLRAFSMEEKWFGRRTPGESCQSK
jgi:hypothetical protein